MSEPLGVEERARLRALANNWDGGRFPAKDMLAVLDEVDRLTEAHALLIKVDAALMTQVSEWKARAERAEADIAELRAGVEALIESADCNQRPVTWRLDPDGLRKLLL